MRISFDIDDTLVLHGQSVLPERGRLPSWMLRRLAEPLRSGTAALVRELRRRRVEVWIYTTSARSAPRIWWWLFLHGIRVDGIINAHGHRQAMARNPCPGCPSKYPPAFGIDLHVDDSEGVRMEGDRHGFPVVVIDPDDPGWGEAVLRHAARFLP